MQQRGEGKNMRALSFAFALLVGIVWQTAANAACEPSIVANIDRDMDRHYIYVTNICNDYYMNFAACVTTGEGEPVIIGTVDPILPGETRTIDVGKDLKFHAAIKYLAWQGHDFRNPCT